MSLTAQILEVCVPSGIFCYRNMKKFENGEKARGTVAFAQGAKVAQAISKYNETTAKTAGSAVNAFNTLAKESKIIDYTGKAVNFAMKNVNPLIVASGVIKTVTSDDKIGTGITETGALAGMFAGEGLMKLNLPKIFNEKNITAAAKTLGKAKWLEPISKFLLKSGNSGKVAAILKGLTFVCGSCLSYSLGQKLAQSHSDRIKAGLGIKTDKKAETDKTAETAAAKKIDQKA